MIAVGVGSAVRFVAMAWHWAWTALALAAAACGGLLMAIDLGATGPWQAAWFGAALLTVTVAQGALYRLALARPGIGPRGLQWGRAEGRLLAVWLLTAVFVFILGLLLFIVLIACAYAVASAGAGFVAADPGTWAGAVDARGRFGVGAVAAIGVAALAWARMRICLAPAASVARDRLLVLATWPMTRGRVGSILAATALTGLGPGLLLAGLSFAVPAAAGKSLAIVGAVNLARGLVVAGLWLPLDAGLMTYFYRRLAADLSDPPAAP